MSRDVRLRGGQPTDIALVVARVAAARALRPDVSVRSLAAEAHVGRKAIREALRMLQDADTWAYESQGRFRGNQGKPAGTSSRESVFGTADHRVRVDHASVRLEANG